MAGDDWRRGVLDDDGEGRGRLVAGIISCGAGDFSGTEREDRARGRDAVHIDISVDRVSGRRVGVGHRGAVRACGLNFKVNRDVTVESRLRRVLNRDREAARVGEARIIGRDAVDGRGAEREGLPLEVHGVLADEALDVHVRVHCIGGGDQEGDRGATGACGLLRDVGGHAQLGCRGVDYGDAEAVRSRVADSVGGEAGDSRGAEREGLPLEVHGVAVLVLAGDSHRAFHVVTGGDRDHVGDRGATGACGLLRDVGGHRHNRIDGIAGIAFVIVVDVSLIFVGDRGAVVLEVVDAVLVVIPVRRGVTGIADTITVGVGLSGVGDREAVVRAIGNPVTVRVDDGWRNCAQRERRGAGGHGEGSAKRVTPEQRADRGERRPAPPPAGPGLCHGRGTDHLQQAIEERQQVGKRGRW